MPANRRQFVCAALGGSGLGFSAWAWLAQRDDATSHPPTQIDKRHMVSRTSRALGAEVSMTVLHADRRLAEQALTAAYAELELIEEVMSLYRQHSQICLLNRSGGLDRPHPYLVEVLRAALEMSARTEGAFDVSVQPLWNLYSQARQSNRWPEEAEIERFRRGIDWRKIDLAADRIQLGPGMQITLNGIAQGFATDRAMAALRNHSIEHALVNTGEIGALGGRTPREPWKVGIQHPRQADAYVSLARLQGRTLATSGDYATRWTDDFRLHHIVDPRTGLSPPDFASVSVVAPTGMQADALSTALFVLGLDPGLKLIESLPNVEALFVLKDGRTLETTHFPSEV